MKSVKYIGSDSNLFDQFAWIIGHDNNSKYDDNKFWLITDDTYNKLLDIIPQSDLELQNKIDVNDIGNEMKLSLYPYQKDVVQFCLNK